MKKTLMQELLGEEKVLPRLHYEVIIKLIGKIQPVADSTIDKERFENLTLMCDFIQTILCDIEHVAQQSDSKAYSCKRAGEFAREFLNQMCDDFKAKEDPKTLRNGWERT